MNITRDQVLANLEDVKKYISEIENKKEEKVVGIAIKNRFTGSIIFQSTKTTFKEAVIERLKSNANLNNANLSDADLRDADLSNADLRGANLGGADLSDAKLNNANLRDADLRGADLSDADFSNANLNNADLNNADLRCANLRGANLRGAELHNAKFYGCGGTKELKRSQLPDFLGALGFVIVD